MQQYYQLTVARSDGVATFTQGNVQLNNEPKPEELAERTNKGITSCFKRVAEGEAKDLQWRRKLAGMLTDVLGSDSQQDKKHILKALPENYVLWHHLKYAAGTDNAVAPKKGSHAAGNDLRNDAYLFGHPLGNKKKYRSPQEFFPHLLWLTTDLEANPDNCSCKYCGPSKSFSRGGDDGGAEDEEEEEENNVPPSKKEHATSTSTRATVVASMQVSRPASTQPPAPQVMANASRYVSAVTPEQEFDSRPDGAFIYRPGELVWFNKDARWGLAVICRRQMHQGQTRYMVQPLSNPLQLCPTQIKSSEKLRPWLAWSVPETTFPKLRGLTFDQVPWDRVVRGDFREPQSHGDAEVDGSILAAKAVDCSYSFFDRWNHSGQAGETFYNGMYLGGEKVWVGDPVKVRSSVEGETQVLAISQIIEQQNGQASFVTIAGVLYKFVQMASPYASRQEWPSSNLPPRLAADLRFRNESADTAGLGQYFTWTPLDFAARKPLSDITGRWYESKPLLIALAGAEKAQAQIRTGRVSDGLSMNNRMGSDRSRAVKKNNRLDSLGRSVPQQTRISRGLNGPAEEQGFVMEQPQAVAATMPYSEDSFIVLDDDDDNAVVGWSGSA